MSAGASHSSDLSFLIVVPTLDSYRQLPRLIESLKIQTYPSWRLLFVDGPSSDVHRRWLSQCCSRDGRITSILQNPPDSGIFGAMNQGFMYAKPHDWLLFWGSDDWAAGPNVLADSALAISSSSYNFDLLVSQGRYSDSRSGVLTRPTIFHSPCFLRSSEFRRSLLFGSTPPHQATFFGPGARLRLSNYSSRYRLAADLDYFLCLSRSPDLCVKCIDLELVHMSDAGVSAQQTHRRLNEVRLAYYSHFGFAWPFPFVARYIRRLLSLFFKFR